MNNDILYSKLKTCDVKVDASNFHAYLATIHNLWTLRDVAVACRSLTAMYGYLGDR